ncbi:MAG: TonB family protein [Muribaculaceae bacterium]|nr:TonB family protein [Muribaculaceae bacterium]
MSQLLSYAISSALFLIPLYLVFKWMMSGENQPRFNRVILLSVYAIALLAPCVCRIPWQTLFRNSGQSAALPDVTVGLPVAIGIIPDAASPSPLWRILLIIYIVGVFVAAGLSIATLFSLMRIIRQSSAVPATRPYSVRVLPDATGIAPFSWIRYIIMPQSDFTDTSVARLIVLHESCHLRRRHWIDLLLAQIVCIFQWFNPAAWLMRDELRSIHEYQADSDVIASLHGNLSDYQNLLIKKAVGARFPSLANSLNHSNLKKRITMMYKSSPSAARSAFRAIAVAPAIAGAVMLLNVPAVSAAISSIASTSLVSHREVSEIPADIQTPLLYLSEIDESVEIVQTEPAVEEPSVAVAPLPDKKSEAFKTAEVMPLFPGGEKEMMFWLSRHIVYPAEAVENDIQGTVVVKFIVEKDGKVTDPSIVRSVDPLLDAEAIRVVSELPDFTPGKNRGKPVAVWYTLPIRFRLQGDAPKATNDSVVVKKSVSLTVNSKENGKDSSISISQDSQQMRPQGDSGQSQNISFTIDTDKTPSYMIDGVIVSGAELQAMSAGDIESISLFKDNPDYPNGLIKITTKKAAK